MITTYIVRVWCFLPLPKAGVMLTVTRTGMTPAFVPLGPTRPHLELPFGGGSPGRLPPPRWTAVALNPPYFSHRPGPSRTLTRESFLFHARHQVMIEDLLYAR